jgi:hypothetical protein
MNGPIRTLLLTIVLMTTAAAAQDLPSDRFGPPLILRLKGVVEPTPEAARHTDGFAVVSLGFLGDGAPAQRWLGVDDARTLDGDGPLGKDVLEVVEPFQPNLLVAGPADLVAKLRDAPPGTALDIEGLVDGDSRIYYLRRVERGAVKPEPSPHAATRRSHSLA